MQLVKVTHVRCSEYAATTFVLAPDEWLEDDIDAAVLRAQNAYLEALKVANDHLAGGPPRASFGPPFASHPDKKVSEVIAAHEEAKRKRAEWEKRDAPTRRSFENFLTDEGFVSLHMAADNDACTVTEVDWGHRHGTRIDYGETFPDGWPSPRKLARAAQPSDPLLEGNFG